MARKRSDGSKMLPCHKCCPAGTDGMGRYHKAGKVAHDYTAEDWSAEPTVWGWKCWNCGHFKKPRAQQQRTSYDYATKEAITDAKLSIPLAAAFHCFNPNGLYAKWKAVADKVGDWVDANPDKPNGVLLVYGSLNDFPRKRLFELLDKKAKATRIDFSVTVSMVRDDIARAEAWLAEKEA
ncbi:hypothetical protein UFOVP131_6 [uncultured Caudovirales phage]|uniref:Uncharacterized protein n=1 Tax=uncultured Caudovirales phage TaxID=2100421 RepID=A0A6J5LCE0_9CAUD|nr:hypothetical protein UFOVP131_6 [uncultured Caudovirales phage]